MSLKITLENLTSSIEVQTESIKSLETKFDCVDSKVKEIIIVLGGSKVGTKGLVEQFQDLKSKHFLLDGNYKDLKTEISTTKKIFTAAGTAITGLISYLNFWK